MSQISSLLVLIIPARLRFIVQTGIKINFGKTTFDCRGKQTLETFSLKIMGLILLFPGTEHLIFPSF